ncbi:MAG: LacI family DNA-binding transcriptional regulator, partial [Bacteroidota bacterium]
MAKMTTIKELAVISNLAPSTISKALNDSSEISEKTRSKVKKIAEEHGYIANNIARSLKLKRTGTIGVIVPNIIDCFFRKVLQGIEAEASKNGYSVFLTFSDDRREDEEQRLIKLLNQSVDGILISVSKQTQESNNYDGIVNARTYGVPLVMFDRVNKRLPFDTVSIDDFAGAFK